jgi:hypothetical protein
MEMSHRAVTVSLSLDEFEMWQALQSRLRRMDVQANNSTPFRAGIRTLAGMDDSELEAAVRATPAIPRGPRPSGEGEGRGGGPRT